MLFLGKKSSFWLSVQCGEYLLGCFGLCFLSTYLTWGFHLTVQCPAHNSPVHGRRVGHTWARPPDRPLGASEWSRACLCPDAVLVSHLQSCGSRHPTIQGLNHGQWGWESLEDLCVPGPRSCGYPGAGLRGCPRFCVPFRPAGPFHLKGGLCRVQTRAHLVLWQADKSAHSHGLVSPP